jgi:hypothetical protein
MHVLVVYGYKDKVSYTMKNMLLFLNAALGC